MNSLMFVFCLLCAIARAICLGVVDEDSFLVRGASKEALLLGKELISRGLLDEGTQKAKDSLKLYPRNDEAASILLELGLGLRAEAKSHLLLICSFLQQSHQKMRVWKLYFRQDCQAFSWDE